MTTSDTITTRIVTYARDDHSAFVTIDGEETYLGSRRTRAEAEKLARDYRFDYYTDGHCPEQAARVAMEEPVIYARPAEPAEEPIRVCDGLVRSCDRPASETLPNVCIGMAHGEPVYETLHFCAACAATWRGWETQRGVVYACVAEPVEPVYVATYYGEPIGDADWQPGAPATPAGPLLQDEQPATTPVAPTFTRAPEHDLRTPYHTIDDDAWTCGAGHVLWTAIGVLPRSCPRCAIPTTDDRRPTTDDRRPTTDENLGPWSTQQAGIARAQYEPAPPPTTSIATLVCLIRATVQAWLEAEQPTPYDAALVRLARLLSGGDDTPPSAPPVDDGPADNWGGFRQAQSRTTQQDDDRRALQANICGEFLTARYHDDPSSFLAKLDGWDERVQAAVTQAVAAHLDEPITAVERLWAESRERLAQPETPPAVLVASAGWLADHHDDDFPTIAAQIRASLAHLGAFISKRGDYVGVQTRVEIPAPGTAYAGAALLVDALNDLAGQLPIAPDSIGASLFVGERLYTFGRS